MFRAARLIAACVLALATVVQAQQQPPPTATVPESPELTARKKAALTAVDGLATQVQEMVDSVFSFAELGFQEQETSRYLTGILEKNVNDTREIQFQLDDDPALSAEEMALNGAIYRITPAADANAPRPDGLRFIPKLNGEIGVGPGILWAVRPRATADLTGYGYAVRVARVRRRVIRICRSVDCPLVRHRVGGR